MSTSELDEPVVITQLKGRTEVDAGAYYAPYVPLQVTAPRKWERVGIDMSKDMWVYNIRSQEIRSWIEEQPVHMWKWYDPKQCTSIEVLIGDNYLFTEEMEAWFTLRWS